MGRKVNGPVGHQYTVDKGSSDFYNRRYKISYWSAQQVQTTYLKTWNFNNWLHYFIPKDFKNQLESSIQRPTSSPLPFNVNSNSNSSSRFSNAKSPPNRVQVVDACGRTIQFVEAMKVR